MNAEKALKQLRKLSKEARELHANSLLTNNQTTLEDVRYSQGYINALDWMEIQLAASMKEDEESDDI